MRTTTAIIALAALLALSTPCTSAAADADYEKGVAYLRAGKAAEAIKMLEPLAASGKDDPYIQYHLGVAYYKAGRLDDSRRAFDMTLQAGGGGQDGRFPLGVAFSNLGVEYYRSGDPDKAADCFGEALAIDPDDGDSRYYMGLVKMDKGDYDGAIDELTKAAGLVSGDRARAAAVGNAAAMAHYRKGDSASAEAGFAKTLELDPDNVEALYYSGLIAYKDRGYAAAAPYFDRIARAGSGDPKTRDALFTTFFNLGVDFQDRGKSDSAAEMFERASQLKPDDAETHYYLGYNLMASERYEDAVAEFRLALSLDPKLDRAKAQMEVAGKFAADQALSEAASLMSGGEFYAALPLYEKAASLDPGSDAARKGLASASRAAQDDTRRRAAEARELLSRGEYTEAKARSEELGRLNPGSPEAAALEGDVRNAIASASGSLLRKAAEAESAGALGEASRSYASLLEIDPDNRTARDGLSRTDSAISRARQKAAKAAGDGLLAEARKAYRDLLKYVPGDPDAESGLRRVEEAIGHEVAKRLRDAEAAFGAEDYTMAAYHLGRAAELDPDNADAAGLRVRIKDRSRELVLRHVREGDAYMADGLRDKAADSYESALLLDPDNQAARAGLGKARSTRKAAVSEEEVRRLYLKGVEHYTRGELDMAVDAWREVLRMDPGNEKAASSIKRAEEKKTQGGGGSRQDGR